MINEKLVALFKAGKACLNKEKNTSDMSVIQMAADLGSKVSHSILASCYEEGLGVPQDKMKALELYRVALEKGADTSDKIKQLEKELNIEPEKERDAGGVNHRHDIFISYSRRNSVIVNQVVDILEKEGYRVWIDRDGIESGDSFKSDIVAAIEQSQVVLFFSSEDSNRSSWTAKEVGVAVSFNKEIIPIKLDNALYNRDILFDLVNLDYVDYSDPETKADNLQKLLRSLSNKIGLSSEEEISLTEKEQEYYDAIRGIVETYGDIPSTERHVLEILRKSLNIPMVRATQIETMFDNMLSKAEQEYIEAYRDMTADGPMSEVNRRILDRIMKASGITQERAQQLEKMC